MHLWRTPLMMSSRNLKVSKNLCGNCMEDDAVIPVDVRVGTRKATIYLCVDCTDSFKRTIHYFGIDVYFDQETGASELLSGGNA
jgi:hypothetical protein